MNLQPGVPPPPGHLKSSRYRFGVIHMRPPLTGKSSIFQRGVLYGTQGFRRSPMDVSGGLGFLDNCPRALFFALSRPAHDERATRCAQTSKVTILDLVSSWALRRMQTFGTCLGSVSVATRNPAGHGHVPRAVYTGEIQVLQGIGLALGRVPAIACTRLGVETPPRGLYVVNQFV